MIKQTIKYVDFNGREAQMDAHFHLSKTEMLELEYGESDTLSDVLEKIIKSDNKGGLILMIKKLVLAAYGKKTDDGERFIKNDQLREEFSQTAAFQEFWLSLMENEEKLDTFVRGIMPSGFLEAMEKVKDQDKPADDARPKPLSASNQTEEKVPNE